MTESSSIKRIFLFSPLILMNLFMALYVCATICYPGGNEFNPGASGYSWASNFYCDLFHRVAYNGKLNGARPIALVSLVVLGGAFLTLWIAVVNCWFISGTARRPGNIIGIMMGISHCLMFCRHDMALKLLMLTGFSAFIYLGGIFWRSGKRTALVLTVIFIAVSSVNFWAWATGFMEALVPLVQKFTMGSLYVWGIYLGREVLRFNSGGGYVCADLPVSSDRAPQ